MARVLRHPLLFAFELDRTVRGTSFSPALGLRDHDETGLHVFLAALLAALLAASSAAASV